MLATYKNGQTSIVLRMKLLNSTASVPTGLTGLTSASTGLIISTVAENEATATTYTAAGSTIEGITTLGTYAAPTATKCRFKEVDSTNHPGVYELQLADARFAVSNAKNLIISISGATNLVQMDLFVQLQIDDPYVAKLLASDVNTQVDTALADIHLDHLLAVDYDPAAKPGVATALLNELVENNAGVSRYTAASLAQAPSSDATAANQSTIITHLTDIKGATWASGTDTLEAIRDRGDAAWTTGAGGNPPQLLQNTTIATLASQTSFTLTAGSADDSAYVGAVAVITDSATSEQKAVGEISAYTGSTKTVTLASDPAIFTMAVGDTIDIIANVSTAPTAVAIRTEIDSNSTQLAAIVADTNELQTDWANAGRLDNILDARASQSSIDALNDIAATDIVSAGAITTLAGAVVNVDTVDTCTTNTDMRGTDNALLAASAPTNFGDMSITPTTGLVDVTQTAADKAWSTGTRVLTAGTNIALAKGTGLTGLNDISTADVNTQVDTALSDIHLDHLLAVDYDPAAKPGVGTALLNELVENNAGVSRYTAAALAQAPSSDATAANQSTIITHLTDIKGATWASGTDTLEAIRDRGDAAWTTGAGGTPPQLLQSTTIATLASQTSFTLTAGSSDNDAYNGAVVVVTDSVTSEQKAVGSISDYVGATKTVTLTSDPGVFTMAVGDTIEVIANASTAPSAAAVRAEIDSNSTQLAAIVADTNELQTDWANAGRLDAILDARASQSSVDALNDLSAADVNAQVDTALADIHLDHLLAVDYDPAVKPGVGTALLNELIENNAGVSRYTAAALAQGPSSDATAANQSTIISNIAALNNIAATDIVSAGPITTLSGAVVNVDTVDTCTTNTDMRGTDNALLAASAPTNFGDMSITATTGLVDVTQGAADKSWSTATRVLTAGTNIALAKGTGLTGLNDIAATDVVSAGAITTLAGAVVNVDLVDTCTTNTDMRGTDSANTVAPDNAGITDIQSRLPAALVSGKMDSNASAIDADTTAATNLKNHALQALPVVFSAGGTTTTAILSTVGGVVASGSDSVYNGRTLVFTSGPLKDQATSISAYSGSTKTATIVQVTAAVDNTSTAILE